MHKTIISIAVALWSIISCTSSKNVTQSSNPAVNSDSVIRKWALASINLECTRAVYSREQIWQILDRIKLDSTKKGNLGRVEDSLYAARKTFTGTAIFIADGNKKYLVTAKHIVVGAGKSLYDDNKISEEISNKISVRTSLDVFLQGQMNDEMVMNLSAGTAESRAYLFSNDAIDIGVISLQSSRTKQILSLIERNGYKPVSVNDLDTSSSSMVGDSIFCIGYPAISTIGESASKPYMMAQRNEIVAPITTFGRIAMTHPILHYMVGDMTIYPGNSGGAVIKKDKLLGITSKQATIPIQTDNEQYKNFENIFNARGTLGIFIKASYILPVLRELQSRERNGMFF